jgi:hypothetical protein
VKAISGTPRARLQSGGTEQLDLSYDELIASFARNNQRMLAKRVVQQHRRLPPAINEQALFTKSCPYGDTDDPFYHSPCNKIGSNYSPEAAVAAAILFEEFPADPDASRKPGARALKLVREAQHARMHAAPGLKTGKVQAQFVGVSLVIAHLDVTKLCL